MIRIIAALLISGCGFSQEYPSTYEEKIEHKILEIQNESRDNDLDMDIKVNVVARGHSKDMSDKNHLSHDGFPEARDRDFKRLFPEYPSIFVLAENVAKLSYFGQDFDRVAYNAMNAWLNSPSHRRNIENETYRRTGIGVYVDDRHIWITQLWFR